MRNRQPYIAALSSLLLALVVAGTLLAHPRAPQTYAAGIAPPTYTITDLGTLADGRSAATALNEAGDVVGYSKSSEIDPETDEPADHAFLWRNGTLTDLGSFGHGTSYASDINEAGVVTITAYDGPNEAAYLWENGSSTEIGAFLEASAINNQRQVVGYDDDVETPVAYVWQAGSKTVLGQLPESSYAFDLNDASQIVGQAAVEVSGADLPEAHAVRWIGTTMTDLGTLGGTTSAAFGINTTGTIVGSAETADSATHAFVWQSGTMTDLGTLGGTYSSATAINDQGVVVGTASLANDASRAFVWQSGVMTDLNGAIPDATGWVLERADDINNVGQIVGTGKHNGATRAFLLTPKPALGLQFKVEQCVVSQPFTLNNGVVRQVVETDNPGRGGRLVCTFNVEAAGDYIIKGVVRAPNNSSNSFFVNIDAEPAGPTMIWDITELAPELAERTVSWRGNGSSSANQFSPKLFSLDVGTHQLIIRGREPHVELDRIMLVVQTLHPTPVTTTPVTETPTTEPPTPGPVYLPLISQP